MQPVQDHHPASMEAVTAIVMVTVGFQEVWDFMHNTFMCSHFSLSSKSVASNGKHAAIVLILNGKPG